MPREEMPQVAETDQEANTLTDNSTDVVVPSQAYQNDQQLAQRVPVRARGDLKWPPAPYRKQPGDDLPAPRTETPRLPKKDYTQFFAQNRLPETHCGYRVAPGVCHITPEEGRYLPNNTTSF
ncbi:hypothetical protein FJT64_010588 [Amphibalanus amphitrite]|uniref:Uncharacterized protein n=1 Tax=Amphibalanus amphitrite TaxID=1232801 RepID=A0A6A4VL63_AMPAM|nr:hypothetical protein FJT64_010588 [Amphibalanus amphitrite]